LPAQTGTHKRTLRVFKPLPQSTISGIFGFIGGVQAEYKDHEKLLASGDGREVTRVKSMGEVTLTVTTVKHNFANYGYE
jgi:B9 domain-containing protein 1